MPLTPAAIAERNAEAKEEAVQEKAALELVRRQLKELAELDARQNGNGKPVGAVTDSKASARREDVPVRIQALFPQPARVQSTRVDGGLDNEA